MCPSCKGSKKPHKKPSLYFFIYFPQSHSDNSFQIFSIGFSPSHELLPDFSPLDNCILQKLNIPSALMVRLIIPVAHGLFRPV